MALIHDVDPQNVRAVVFDLGGVFLAGGPEDVRVFGVKMGLSEETWKAIRTELFFEGPWDELERGERSFDSFLEIMRGKMADQGVEISADQAVNFMGNQGAESLDRLRHEIVDICGRIKKVLPTALLTNNIKEWRGSWTKKIDVPALFDVEVDSSMVGMRKPEPGIYQLIEEKLNKPGGDLLFVDDLGVNLKAAKARGWQTLKYDDTEKVLSVLEQVIQSAQNNGHRR